MGEFREMRSHTSRAILLGLMISLVLGVLVFTILTRERKPAVTVNTSLDLTKPSPQPAVQPAEKTEQAPSVNEQVPEKTAPLSEETYVFPLQKGERIVGEFVDSCGERIPEVEFFVWGSDNVSDDPRKTPDGCFDITGLPPGNVWTIYARKRGYVAKKVTDLSASPAGERVRIELATGYSLPIHVIDSNGEPVGRIWIKGSYEFEGKQDSRRSGYTDERGFATIDSLPPGKVTLEFKKPGCLPYENEIEVPHKERFEIILQKMFTFRVLVVDENQRPLDFCSVKRLSRSQAERHCQKTCTTDKEGVAEFGGITERVNIDIKISRRGYPMVHASGEAGSEIVVVLGRGSTLLFNLFPVTGELPASCRISVRGKNIKGNQTGYSAGFSIKDGSVTITGLEAGTYTAEVDVPGFITERVKDLQLRGCSKINSQSLRENDHKVVDVEIKQCGTITGIVYARDTGRPIPGVSVSASHESARTDSDGRYRLDKVTRTPVVSFNHRSWCNEIVRNITVPGGETVTIPPVYLTKGASVSCRIRGIPEGQKSIGISIDHVSGSGIGVHGLGGISGISSSSFLPTEYTVPLHGRMKPGVLYRLTVRAGGLKATKEVTVPEDVDEMEFTFDLKKE